MNLQQRKHNAIILLTACINPNGMLFTEINDSDLRLRQYMLALDFYLSETMLKIVFCENSGFDISTNYIEFIRSGRLEVITFMGNDYDRMLGKGFGEALILEKAIQCSKFIRESGYIIKITGRIIIRNINLIMQTLPLKSEEYIYSSIYSPAQIAYSVFFIANQSFFKDFLDRKKEINDFKGIYFEHVLYSTIRDWIAKGRRFSFFLLPIKYVGVSGSTGQKYKTESYFKCVCRYLLFKTLGYGRIS